ncbi:hypothetical protein LC593_14450 [Nostoc sp. CHAB 5844]|nr:hypothetical protein [Nostoc sp. CHAB 5844]
MNATKTLIAVNTSSPQGMTVTLESTSLFLGILVSVSMLVGVTIKVISKFNSISNSIRDLREDVNKLSAIDTTIKGIYKDVLLLDKRFDIHVQDYTNRKDTIQMLLGQLNEKIDHKSERFEGEIKDIERYLEKREDYKIRSSATE